MSEQDVAEAYQRHIAAVATNTARMAVGLDLVIQHQAQLIDSQTAELDRHGAPAPPEMAEAVARVFHDTYERLAPQFGYETREESAKAWADVPEKNRALMVATVAELLATGVIRGPMPQDPARHP